MSEASRNSSTLGSNRSRSSRASRSLSVYQESLPSVTKSTPSGSLAEVYAQRRESQRLIQKAVGSSGGFEARPSIFTRPSMTPNRFTRSHERESVGVSERRESVDMGDEPAPAEPDKPGGVVSIRRGSSVATAAALAALAPASTPSLGMTTPGGATSTPGGEASTPGGTPVLESNATPVASTLAERV